MSKPGGGDGRVIAGVLLQSRIRTIHLIGGLIFADVLIDSLEVREVA